MNRRLRLLLFVPASIALAGVLLWGLLGLPDFGSRPHAYAAYVLRHAVAQRHVTNIPSAVVFDYRGWDTLGEELILFTSVMGTALLLRSSRDIAGERPQDTVTSATVRRTGAFLVPVTLLLGLWTIAYGYLTPGGGFQGGVICAGAALLIWIAASYRDHRRLTPTALVDAAEGTGAAAYIAVGLAALAAGQAFLAGFLPLGTVGSLLSGGTIALLNWATGLEVAAACVLMFHEFLEEYVDTVPHPQSSREDM
ncbi:MnhB domain-containing protein [Streptomyces sp. SLBN-31]|uniref:MnhB domain-containing protein n=1 Tax=Streptomyces sp. SLBN-31 TaxID=2768444 RepID=UPI001153D492|nr:MnhB domain-containing protein [Streptomyces sp. SLBN-31]TQJ91256.1 multisubunit sodium/proton antiporter MrpB subunit [Streptomyces sp. SLBN-31]